MRSTNRQEVDLRIVAVWLDQDERGKPVTRYEIEDECGLIVGTFLTPVGSRLSEELMSSARRVRRQ